MITSSFTMSTLFATIAVVMMSCMFSVHIARAQSTSTDGTTVASSNDSSESTGTGNTTVASSDNSSESTGIGNTTVASAINSSESTGTDNTNVASSYNSLESAGTDNTNVASSYNSLESTGTDNTNVASSNNSLESTGTDNTNVASSNNSLERVGSHDTTVAYSDSISESTTTDGITLYSASEITSTDYTTVASSGNSPESTGSDSTTLYSTSEITSTDDTTVESTDSTGSFHTETPESTSANGNVAPTDNTGHTDSTTETTETPLGVACLLDSDCTSNLNCTSSKTCGCTGDFYYNSSSSSCSQKILQGGACQSDTDCTLNLNCTSSKTCGCTGDFYYNSSSPSCSQKKPHGGACQTDTECTSNLNCTSSNTCNCTGDFYYNNLSSSCSQKIPHGVACQSDTECTSNLHCTSSNTCDCTGYFYYNNLSSSCSQKKPHGVACQTDTECTSNLNCTSSNTCDCTGDFYYNNLSSSCSQKKPHGVACQLGSECTSNLTCTSNTCGCTGDFYYNNLSSSCSQKKPHGVACQLGSECTSNLTCTSNTCGCTGDFYYNNLSSSCSQKNDHGVVCQSSDECRPSNTVCTSHTTQGTNKCLCAPGFYWTINSSCISQNNLKVNLTNITSETRMVTFVWHEMSQRSDVSFSIRWNGSNKMDATKAGVTVTGLEPGMFYNFSVVTSLPADGNYPLITAEQQAPLWTRPDRPGPVSEVRRETDSTYKITFGHSNGSVDHYTMSVSSVGSLIETQSSTSTSTVMYFTKLKAVTTYTYILKSYSGNSEESDPATGSFTTDPEASGPVTAFSYSGVQSHTANVTWQPPSQANGNITGYLVEVINTTGCLYYIKIPCYDCDEAAPNVSSPTCPLKDANITSSSKEYNLQLPDLTPYRNYTAIVRTVNERGPGEQASVTFQTSTSAPNDILDLTVYSVRDDSTQKINLNITWTPGDQTGLTDYYILVQEAAGQDTTEHNPSTNPLIVTGYSSTTYVKYDVLAYWNYTVCVWAQTDKGNSSQKCAQNRTVENYPGAVPSLNVSQDATVANIVTLTFECPEIRSRNGSIEKFVITRTHLDSQGQEIREIYTQSASDGQSEPCSSGYKVIVKNITVEKDYSFTVMTVNNKYEGGVKNVSKFYIQPKVPHLVNPQEMFNVGTLVKQQNGSAIELTKINADICSTCLTDVRWGNVIDVGILVCVKGANCTVPGRKKRSTALQFTNISSWGSAKLQDFKIQYRTTPNKWVPPVIGNNKYNTFVVGDNTTCSHANAADYCNGPLPAGQEVYISVIMCTTAGCSVYREPHVFATYVPEDDDSHIGAIVGGVLGGLALIGVIGVIIFLVWHIRKRNEKQPRPHVVTTNEGKELIKKRPVRMRDFNDHVAKFHRDSKLLFQDEFESIRTISETFKNTCDEAKREQNRVKNRYADILPYDHSRVKLEILADDDETNNFINANYIPGYNSVREYIATQGPMYSTMPDFWKMIWEHKCKMIVMLSDLMESGKRKVDLYWPENLNEPITYGTVVVEMTNFSQLNKYIIRNFKLIKGEETRKVTHFFLPGWPDYGADIDFEVLLGFVKAVRREITPANQGPIVVHCSAGVGRSGTFIALDYFTQFVEKHSLDESIDVFDFVLQMRKNRTRMVQVETQYICIYDSINRLIQSKIKSEEEKLYENVSPGNGVYENFKPQEENIYANTTVKDDKYVYNNEAFEPDFGHSQKSDKPTTEL